MIHIIGGGIIGMSTAYQLSKHTKVKVFEQDKAYTNASFARSCGGFRAQYSTATNVQMSKWSVDFIKNETNVQFTPNGYLMLFDDTMKSDHDNSIALQQSLGASTQSFTPDEVKQRFPYINTDDLYRGCITTNGSEGWLDPVTLHAWYREQCKKQGVEFVWNDARLCDHSTADAIVITAGYWSQTIGKHFGVDIPVEGQKHTVFNVSTTKPVYKDLPLVADLPTGVYLRPEGDGYIVGYDGNNDGQAADLEPNWDSWDEIWLKLYHRFPNVFDEAKTTGAWAGYYDTSTIDNNAIIDHKDNVFFATGFTGRGLMHSPAVGLVLSEMVLGNTPTFDVSEYRLNRVPNVEKYVI